MVTKAVCQNCIKSIFARMKWPYSEQDDKELFADDWWYCPIQSKGVRKGGKVPKDCDYTMEHLVNNGVEN